MFISGTVPNKTLIPIPEEDLENIISAQEPKATPTPFTTWEEAQVDQKAQKGQKESEVTTQNIELLNTVDTITLMYCPVSKKRATANCPNKFAKVFKAGNEPKEFCPIHDKKPPN